MDCFRLMPKLTPTPTGGEMCANACLTYFRLSQDYDRHFDCVGKE